MEAHRLNNLSIQDYLDIEASADTCYEYHNGKIFAMAGGTIEHGLISGNTFGEIKFGLRNAKKACQVINSEVKLHVDQANKFLHPDVMVVCGDLERSDSTPHAIVNPTVIIEVLSKTTERYDRGDKFFAYRQISTLKEYILIDQYQVLVDAYQRRGDLWKISRLTDMTQVLRLSSLGLEINIASLYEGVEFIPES